jgi:starch phosphorylase
MSVEPPISKPMSSYLSKDIEGFDSRAGLALDLRWSWNHATDNVWRQLDPAPWELTQNRWVVRHSLEQKWGKLRLGEVKVETKGQQHIFDVQVYLNDPFAR